MARDAFHAAVKTALEKDGWQITDDPLRLEVGGVKLEIDLAAERDSSVIAAVRGGAKIAIEIKSFVEASAIYSFHGALGQFMNYRLALESIEPDRVLYLAVPTAAFDEFFQLEFTQQVVARYDVRLLVYDPIKQEIRQWL
jgi:XisH protein